MFHGEISTKPAQGLRVLRNRIEKAGIPPSQLDETLNVATWNIRAFGAGDRLDESLHFIAEIVGQFDLVAVTELRDDLTQLEKVLEYLGPYWRAIYSDFNVDNAGNHERIAYVFDKRAVVPTGLVAEADPYKDPAEDPTDPKKKVYVSRVEWWRSPYMCSFRAGDFDFILVTAHIRYQRVKDRVAPIRELARWVKERSEESNVRSKDMIVMGDFNIPTLGSSAFEPFDEFGFHIPDALMQVAGSDLSQSKHYDQILHLERTTGRFTNVGGVVDFFDEADGGFEPLYPGVTMTKNKFTFQLSDHLPLWVQMDTWTGDAELDEILGPEG